LLLPTIADCYGMVFCEAAAFGLPVVATDTGGVSSIVINERTGILIKDPLDYKH
ncbi:glycosyltransferase, partial [Escherichia coli]|uniref:glycosyltransferase n=1 Tax=Escherichia coli TaxID=562 RepID=UPI0010CC3466